jgi:hypothetical protein
MHQYCHITEALRWLGQSWLTYQVDWEREPVLLTPSVALVVQLKLTHLLAIKFTLVLFCIFFVFVLDPDDVSVAEIEDVKRMIHLLNFYQGRLSEVTVTLEDELCTICYACPISATFRPCNHQSCRYVPYCCLVCHRNLWDRMCTLSVLQVMNCVCRPLSMSGWW